MQLFTVVTVTVTAAVYLWVALAAVSADHHPSSLEYPWPAGDQWVFQRPLPLSLSPSSPSLASPLSPSSSPLELPENATGASGVHVYLRANFFDFVAKGAVSVLQNGFTGIQIPNVTTDAPVPVLGDVSVELSEMKVSQPMVVVHGVALTVSCFHDYYYSW